MAQTCVTYVLLIIPASWVNNQKGLVGFRCVVINNVITYSVRPTSFRKLDVAHDKRKQLIISGNESFSVRFFSFVSEIITILMLIKAVVESKLTYIHFMHCFICRIEFTHI